MELVDGRGAAGVALNVTVMILHGGHVSTSEPMERDGHAVAWGLEPVLPSAEEMHERGVYACCCTLPGHGLGISRCVFSARSRAARRPA